MKEATEGETSMITSHNINRYFRIVIICIVLSSFAFILTGFNAKDTLDYKLTFNGKEKTVSCMLNESGVLLVSLKDVMNIIGYEVVEECASCGYVIICSSDENEAEFIGNVRIYWLRNIVSFEKNWEMVTLDANTELIGENTYTSLQLYEHMGFSVEINQSDKIINIRRQSALSLNDGDNQDNPAQGSVTQDNSKKDNTIQGNTSQENFKQQNPDNNKLVSRNENGDNSKSADNLHSFVINEILYAFDPNCYSCKQIESLLETYTKTDIRITKIDATNAAYKNKLKEFYSNCNVPNELRDIFPMLFIGDNYLFDSEITRDNIDKALKGEKIRHLFKDNYAMTADAETDDAYIKDKVDLNRVKENYIKKCIVYFYSSSCASCRKVEDFIDSIVKRHKDIEVKRYNISDINNAKLLQAYAKQYGISELNNISIPAVFISNTALIGEDKIINELEERISFYDVNNPTPQLSVGNLYESDVPEDIRAENLIAVFGAGLVNGINPCSLSMFLFLFSLIMTERKNILKVGISFCVGKFLMFFLLGTLLYRFISIFDINWVNAVVKIIVLVIVSAFAVLNINDFVAAKKEKYNKMVLQLPKSLKNVYHSMMKKSIVYTSGKYAVFIMALLGMFLAIGEFLCTGQVYLFSVVFLIQRGGQGIEPLLCLLIYSFAFVLPLLLMTLIIFRGKKVFNLSENLLERLPAIKIISAVFFIAFGVYMAIFN